MKESSKIKPVKKNNTFVKTIIKSINEKSKVDICVDVKFLNNIIKYYVN